MCNNFHLFHLGKITKNYYIPVTCYHVISVIILLVLAITCLEWGFEINCRVHSWKFWNCPSKTRAISKFSKNTRVIYPKSCPNQTCDYWLIKPNQETLCFETNIFKQRAITNQWVANYKTAGNSKTTPLTVQCRFQSILWLNVKVKGK